MKRISQEWQSETLVPEEQVRGSIPSKYQVPVGLKWVRKQVREGD